LRQRVELESGNGDAMATTEQRARVSPGCFCFNCAPQEWLPAIVEDAAARAGGPWPRATMAPLSGAGPRFSPSLDRAAIPGAAAVAVHDVHADR